MTPSRHNDRLYKMKNEGYFSFQSFQFIYWNYPLTTVKLTGLKNCAKILSMVFFNRCGYFQNFYWHLKKIKNTKTSNKALSSSTKEIWLSKRSLFCLLIHQNWKKFYLCLLFFRKTKNVYENKSIPAVLSLESLPSPYCPQMDILGRWWTVAIYQYL